MIDLATVKPGDVLTYLLTPGAYGYPRSRGKIEVKAHCTTAKRVKCEFSVGSGRIVHRWLAPQNLSFAR